ncbi:hypothetical protein CPB86DRAFT_819460 [Serendipita vermifera]|nr:hypothetical protein CPB86DRAFT_819460 [Serendipita vermifera]
MSTVLQIFKKCSSRLYSKMGRNVPGLRYEIWALILEMAIYPNFIRTEDPLQIEAGFACTIYRYLCSQRTVQISAVIAGNRLQLVCKTWKEIVDTIRSHDKGVVDHFYIDGDGSLPIDTRQHSRLNVNCRIEHTSCIHVHWTHPVPIVSMRFNVGHFRDGASAKSLSHLVSFPEQVKTLELELRNFQPAKEVFTDLQTTTSQLTTLCLTLMGVNLAPKILTVSTLVTLSLSIPKGNNPEFLREFYWNLPSLRNLSLSKKHHREKNYISNHPEYMPPSTNRLFIALLRDHFSQLESLLISPMTWHTHSKESTLFWALMPKLQVLATNFNFQKPSEQRKTPQEIKLSITRLESVRHLIHFSEYTIKIGAGSIEARLCDYIPACNQLQEITLVDAPDNLKMHLRGLVSPKAPQMVKELIKLCDERRIQVWEQSRIQHWGQDLDSFWGRQSLCSLNLIKIYM